MLSIYLTQHLALTHQVIYFFCQADDETRRSAPHVLRSLIWQLATQLPACAHQLPHYLFPSQDKQAVLDSRESLWSLFKKMLSDLGSSVVLCLLDGLDECDDDTQRWLASKLMNTCIMPASDASTYNLGMIIVSRPTTRGLRADKCILLDSDNNVQIGRDIDLFVRTKVKELSTQLDGISDEIRSDFESRMQAGLMHRAENTFLWVGFAATELLKQKTRTEMEAAMLELPKGLPALYDRMLLQINPRYQPTSAKILRWVAMAVHPLSVGELADIIGPGDSGLSSSAQRIHDQILICGAFIVVSDAAQTKAKYCSTRYDPWRTRADRVVSLVHESAREILSYLCTDS